MRYLLLSVLVVCVIGVMIPSVFADTPIKNGMWIMQKIDVSADIRTDDHSWTEQTFEQSLLRNLYGIESEYRLNNVGSIKTEIIDVTENGCLSKIFLIEKNGHEEFIGEGSDFCKYSEEFRMLKIGDTFSYPWGRGTIAELRNELPMLDVKEFTTITIGGKKVDVINAYVKDFSADQTGSIKYEVELVIHKQTGILLGYYYDIEARGDWNEWLNLEKTLDLIDVSHHFVEAVVEPELKSEPTQQASGGCGEGTVLVDGVCQIASTGKTQFIDFMDVFLDNFKHTVECGSGENYYICQGEFWDDDGVRYDLGFRQDLNKEENIFAHISNVSQTEKISELDATCYSGWFMESLKRLVCVKDNEFSIKLTVLKYHDPIPMMKQILNKIDGKLSLPGVGNSIEPLYLIIGVVAIGGVIGAIAVAKRGSKTPKPAKEEPKEEPKKKETSGFCENCGNSLKPTTKFCGKCGNQV